MVIDNRVQVSIIPKPVSVQHEQGYFTWTAQITVKADALNQQNQSYLQEITGLAGQRDDESLIHLACDSALTHLGREGYRLQITAQSIQISGADATGVFYGIQTLRQLLPVDVATNSSSTWQIPCLIIEDTPRFTWRGFMLDEGRHFHGKETVLLLLDVMALLKLNIFHWHLTEDQGWRIEIKQYPRLTEIGAQRQGTAKSFLDIIRNKHDGVPHSGYYTQADIQEIVAYAAARHITVVPEIEMPGHAKAALAAYPEYSCTGGSFEVNTRFGISRDIYCAGKEETFIFLQNILDEVISLFPSPYIHIGGDEAPHTRWKKCPDCQQRMADEGLHTEDDLQTYMTNRMAHYLADNNRRLVGWNEALDEKLHPDAIIQYWIRNKKGVIEAIRQGRQVVVSSFLVHYLDHSYSLTPLSKIYNNEPVFKELDEKAAQNIIGVEAPLWSEWIPNRARLDYQAFPRLVALAEIAWTQAADKSYDDFIARWAAFRKHLDALDIRYAPDTDVEPSRLKQLFGLFTILQAQRKTQ